MNDVGGRIFDKAKIMNSKCRNTFYHKTKGHYNFDVVEEAAKDFGVILHNVTQEDVHKLKNKAGAPAYIVWTKETGNVAHYYTIRRINGDYWDLDSGLSWPQRITLSDIEECMNNHLSRGKGRTVFMKKVELEKRYYDILNKNSALMSVTDSNPCSLDQKGKGHWWVIDVLDEL